MVVCFRRLWVIWVVQFSLWLCSADHLSSRLYFLRGLGCSLFCSVPLFLENGDSFNPSFFRFLVCLPSLRLFGFALAWALCSLRLSSCSLFVLGLGCPLSCSDLLVLYKDICSQSWLCSLEVSREGRLIFEV